MAKIDVVLKVLGVVACLIVIYAGYLYIRDENEPTNPCAERYGEGTNEYMNCILRDL